MLDDLSNKRKDTGIMLFYCNNIYQIVVPKYVTYNEFDNNVKSWKEFNVTDLINPIISANGYEIKTGTYYIINKDNKLYNFFINTNGIKIIQRSYEMNNDVKSRYTIHDRTLSYDFDSYDYSYSSLKHTDTGNTYDQKYYKKNNSLNLPMFLSRKEAFVEINDMLNDINSIDRLRQMLDLDRMNEQILEDLSQQTLEKN